MVITTRAYGYEMETPQATGPVAPGLEDAVARLIARASGTVEPAGAAHGSGDMHDLVQDGGAADAPGPATTGGRAGPEEARRPEAAPEARGELPFTEEQLEEMPFEAYEFLMATKPGLLANVRAPAPGEGAGAPAAYSPFAPPGGGSRPGTPTPSHTPEQQAELQDKYQKLAQMEAQTEQLAARLRQMQAGQSSAVRKLARAGS